MKIVLKSVTLVAVLELNPVEQSVAAHVADAEASALFVQSADLEPTTVRVRRIRDDRHQTIHHQALHGLEVPIGRSYGKGMGQFEAS